MRRSLLALALTAATGGSAAAAPLDAVRSFDDPRLSPIVDQFGGDVSVSGNNIFVSDLFDDANGTQSGQVSMFDATTGALIRTFDDPTPTRFSFFGQAIASEGDRVLIGANNSQADGVGAGQAYLFNSATGALLQTFNDPSPVRGDSFGGSVSISGDNILIGAARDATNGESAGQAYLFSASTGALLQTFNHPNPTPFDTFGFSVSVSGDTVAVGSNGDISSGTAEGVVHLFSASTGDLLHTLNDPTPTGRDRFGADVATSGNLVLVGAVGDGTNGNDVGQAHLFDAVTGELLFTFDDPTITGLDGFGVSVAIDGDKIVIGADEDDSVGDDAGQAYVFSVTTGELLYTLNDPAASDGNLFGVDVAISGDNVIVGALRGGSGTNGSSNGRAHLFNLPPDAVDPGPIAVSEPATLALFGLGLFGLGAVGRRRWRHRS